jgi:hypothetical protein
MGTANFWVAIGTILLAIASFVNIWMSRKQAQVFTRQLILQRSQLIPNLRIKKLEFKGNIAEVDIENFSDVPGYEVGLSSSFYLTYPEYYASKDQSEKLSESRVKQMNEEKKQLYWRFQPLINHNIVFENEKMASEDYITFLITSLNEATLLPHQMATIHVEPQFYISSNKSENLSGMILDFNILKDTLLQNNQIFAAVNIVLVYKDKLETPMGFEPYAKFIINFNKHKTLEDAWRDGVGYNFLALSPGQIQREIKGTPMSMYKNAKSSRSPEMLEKADMEFK